MTPADLTPREILDAHRDGVLLREEARQLLGVDESENDRLRAEVAALRDQIVAADEAHNEELARAAVRMAHEYNRGWVEGRRSRRTRPPCTEQAGHLICPPTTLSA